MNRAVLALALTCLIAQRSGYSDDPPAKPRRQAAVPIRRIESRHLPNSYRLTDKVISGGQPDGDAAFAELSALGVKTIISVDGARPDVAAAKKFGLRYVHLPHGYDGIADDRLKELAKAVRDLPGPIYIHCHHGKHRSPAAAAAACVTVGMLEAADALTVLKIAGTSPSYRGLFSAVASAKKVDPAVLNMLPVEFREVATVPPLADAMVAIEHIHDRLKAIAAAGWKPPADHPDLEPAHEALMLKEEFAELLRTEMVKKRPPRFVAMLHASDEAAGQLEAALRTLRDVRQATAAFAKISSNCQACHQSFRDVPLGEKPLGVGTKR